MTQPRAQGAAYVYAPQLSRHVLREGHPMRPVRLQYAFDLLAAYGAFDDPRAMLVEPRAATDDEIALFHDADYAAAVRRYSEAGRDTGDGMRYGFAQQGDNPIYPGMYEAAALATGASIVAADLVADGTVRAAFSPAGGLHHAARGHASGFCVFNDPAVAIERLRARGLRVAYVDIDAHHGDGVQAAFYDAADVLTISVHESGRYLFPGTGDADETGVGEGAGYAVNLPLAPFTGDAVYLEVFDAVVLPLLRAFAPDVLATQLGVDSYASDPLTHLGLSTNSFIGCVERFAALGVPWLAFGGGGYDLDAVARCWALAYGVMLDREWDDAIPPQARAFLAGPCLRDAPQAPENEWTTHTRAFAQRSVEQLKATVFPTHGLAGR